MRPCRRRKDKSCCRPRCTPTASPRRGGLADRRAPSTGERNYYLSNLPADTALKQLAGAIKARRIWEQAHQQLKEELGHHFEGRSWTGLHRHALMTMIAYAFLQSQHLKQARGRKKIPRTATPAQPAHDPPGHPHRPRDAAADTMSSLPQISMS